MTPPIVALVNITSLKHVLQKSFSWLSLFMGHRWRNQPSIRALRIQAIKMRISAKCRQSHPSGGTRAEISIPVAVPIITIACETML